MDQEQTPFVNQKYSCPIEGHDLQDITLCCTSSTCEMENRVMCVYCLYYDHFDHTDKVVLIKDIEESQKPYVITNWPSAPKIRRISQLFNKQEKEFFGLKVIDPLFDDLKDSINNEIEKVRKWVHENTMKIVLKGSKLKEKIDEGFTLEPLQQILNNFSKKYGKKDVDSKFSHLDEINDYVDQFITFDRLQYVNELKALYKHEIIKGGRLQYDENKIREVIYNIKIFLQQVKPSFFVGPMDLKFYASNSKQSSKYVQLKDNQFIFEGSRGQGTIVYSDVFPRSRNFSIKFQFQDSDVGHESFYFGIAANQHKDGIFWFDSGNQIDMLKKTQNSRKPFRTLKNSKLPGQIIEKGTIFTAEICAEQNILKLYDTDNLTIMENAFVFEEYQDWRVVFGIYSKHHVVIEILDQWAYIN